LLEPLEERWLLSGMDLTEVNSNLLLDTRTVVNTSQTVYLDFDGAQGVVYDGPVTVGPFAVPVFDGIPFCSECSESALIEQIAANVREVFANSDIFAPFNIQVVTQPPAQGLYSTIYIGGDDSAFAEYGSFLGLAEQVDRGNLDLTDNAFVFSDFLAQHLEDADPAAHMAEAITHEAAHLFGYSHDGGPGPLTDVAIAITARLIEDQDRDGVADFGEPPLTGAFAKIIENQWPGWPTQPDPHPAVPILAQADEQGFVRFGEQWGNANGAELVGRDITLAIVSPAWQTAQSPALVSIGNPDDVIHLGDIPGVKPVTIRGTLGEAGSPTSTLPDPDVWLDVDGNGRLDKSIDPYVATIDDFEFTGVFPGDLVVRSKPPENYIQVHPPGIGLLATAGMDFIANYLVELRTDPSERLNIGTWESRVDFMDCNPIDGFFYGVDFFESLVRIDTNTGEHTPIGLIGAGGGVPLEIGSISGFTFDPGGTAYIVATPQGGQQTLHTIDHTTGFVTAVAPIEPGFQARSIEFGRDGTLYATSPGSGSLFVLDSTTGALISEIPISGGFDFNADLDCPPDGSVKTITDGNALTMINPYTAAHAIVGTYAEEVQISAVATYEVAPGDGQGLHRLNARSGEVFTNVDFLFAPLLTVQGIAFEDLNRNGIREAGEFVLSDVPVGLDKDPVGQLNQGDMLTTTDSNGYYRLSTSAPTGAEARFWSCPFVREKFIHNAGAPVVFSTGGTVVVDVVYVEMYPVDYPDAGFSESGPGFEAGGPAGAGGDHRYSEPDTGNTATWTFNGLNPGLHQVSATWVEHPDHASNAHYRVKPWPFTSWSAYVDQRQEPDDFTEDGIKWETLRIVEVPPSGIVTVTLTDSSADGRVIADAVRIERPPTATVDLPGGGGAYDVFRDGPDIVASQTGGAESWRGPADATGGLIINGSNADDTLIVDFTSGNPIPMSGGLLFNGGGSGDNDAIQLTGGAFTTATHSFDNVSDGAVNLDGYFITYTGLEPIVDNVDVVDRVFTFPDTDEDITLNTGDDPNDNVFRIDSGNSEVVDFEAPTGSLTVNFGDGDDGLTLELDAVPLVDGQGGKNDLVLAASGLDLDLTAIADSDLTQIDTIDIANSGANTLTLDQQEVLNMSDASDTMYAISDSDDTVNIGDGWELTGTQVENGRFFRVVEQGDAKLLLNGPHHWQNPADVYDVNTNGGVSTLDVLETVFYINTHPNDLVLPDPLVTPPANFYDVNGDDLCSSLDVLMTITYINSVLSGSNEGEAVERLVPFMKEAPSSALVSFPIVLSPTIVGKHTVIIPEFAGVRSTTYERAIPIPPANGDTWSGLSSGAVQTGSATPSFVWDEEALKNLDEVFAELDAILPNVADAIDNV